jgi:hypothetical protein
MELRLLSTEHEREIFARRVGQARANRDAGAAETPKSRLTAAHIAFANLYGLFEHDDDPPERMIAGLATHDLEALPQSYPKPDLTHLPPRSVVECGELWALAYGGGMLARRGIVIVWRLAGVRAVLIYALIKPWNTAKLFARTYFESVGEPINFPYARALDGSPVWVQPMVLWEAGLRKLFDQRIGGLAGFKASRDLSRVRFDNPLPFQPSLDRPAFSFNGAAARPRIAALSAHGAEATELAQR